MEQSDLFINFEIIRKSFKFEKEQYFINYLYEVFNDLTARSSQLPNYNQSTQFANTFTNNNKKFLKGISKIVFADYFKLPGFIFEKLFITLDKDNDGYLNANEFINGMTKLYRGSFEETAEFIFNIFDFDKDGIISKGDVKVLLSYLPIKALKTQSEYNNQMKSLADLDQILKDTFDQNDKMGLNTFMNVIVRKKSDIYLQLLLFFYIQKPFSEGTVNACKEVKKGLQRTKFLSIKTNDADKILRIPSPSKRTCLAPSEIFFDHLYNSINKFSPTSNINNKEMIRMTNKLKLREDKNKDKDKGISYEEALESLEKKIVSPTNYLNKNRGLYKKGKSSSLITLQSVNISEEEGENIGDIEDVVYRFDEKDEIKNNFMSFKKYYLALHGAEISIYQSKEKDTLLSIHNLSGTFILVGDEMVRNKTTFYSVIIQISKNSNMKFYYENKQTRDKWLTFLKKGIGYQNFSDYYSIFNTVIGKGNFGIVKLGIHKSTNMKVAVKIIAKGKLKEGEYELIRRELDIMKFFHHPNLVRLLDHYENADYIYIVMEYLSGGDLKQLLKNNEQKLTEKQIALLIKQIAQGILYLNKFGVIHRDIKPENLMLKKKGDLKTLTIIDFGLTKTLAPSEKLDEGMGTIAYVAPEVLQRKLYNKSVDVWSIGVVMYYLTGGGELPFYDDSEEGIARKIIYSAPSFNSEFFKGRSEECKKIINMCLQKNPEMRMMIDSLLSSDWIIKNS